MRCGLRNVTATAVVAGALALVSTPANAAHRREQAGEYQHAAAVGQAVSQLGVPYRYGAQRPGRAFDCAGLVQWAYRQAGIILPRIAVDQYRAVGHKVSRRNLRPGDLIFFGHPAYHVGLWIGRGRFIHSPHTGSTVTIQRFTSWYQAAFSGAVRP